MIHLYDLCRLMLVLIICYVFPVSSVAQNADNKQHRKPNIILILADDLGYETLQCNGGKSYNTPHLDKMAAEAARFTHCYSLPLCTPSRVQLMTGRYGFRNYKKFGVLDQHERTFGNLLRDNGYKTCIVGKWQLGGDEQTPGHFGFDEHLLWQLTEKDRGERYRNPRLIRNGQVNDYTKSEYGPDLLNEYAIDFISRHKDKPFFLYYPMVLTHDPFQPVPGGRNYDSAKVKGSDTSYFRDMVQYMDKMVGQLIAKIDALNLSEETMIIFTGDNGTARNIYSRFQNTVIKGNKGYPTNAGTHVPLIVKWKGKIAPQTNENLVDFTDFYMTISEAAGVRDDKVKTLDGVSFLGQLLQRKNAPVRNFVFGDYNGKDKGFITARYAHNKTFKVYETGEIYQIDMDPEEKNPISDNNLKPEEKKIVNKLRQFTSNMHE
jgi:arylsulfatase A